MRYPHRTTAPSSSKARCYDESLFRFLFNFYILKFNPVKIANLPVVGSLPRSRFLDVTQRSFWLSYIQKTAARETMWSVFVTIK